MCFALLGRGGLFAFDKGDAASRALREKVFSEEALSEFPVLRECSATFHLGVHPVDSSCSGFVFDAVNIGFCSMCFSDLFGENALLDDDFATIEKLGEDVNVCVGAVGDFASVAVTQEDF